MYLFQIWLANPKVEIHYRITPNRKEFLPLAEKAIPNNFPGLTLKTIIFFQTTKKNIPDFSRTIFHMQ